MLAASAIQNHLSGKPAFKIDLTDYPEELRRHAACFVTLEKDGKLRGCIGSIQAWRPLASDVAENACKADSPPLKTTPPPQITIGLRDRSIALAASSIAPGGGALGQAGNRPSSG